MKMILFDLPLTFSHILMMVLGVVAFLLYTTTARGAKGMDNCLSLAPVSKIVKSTSGYYLHHTFETFISPPSIKKEINILTPVLEVTPHMAVKIGTFFERRRYQYIPMGRSLQTTTYCT